MNKKQIMAALEKSFPGLKVSDEGDRVRVGQIVLGWTEARHRIKTA